jgi:hypothetical protein
MPCESHFRVRGSSHSTSRGSQLVDHRDEAPEPGSELEASLSSLLAHRVL